MDTGRTVLTLSARHPRRYAQVAAVRVPRGDDADALRQLVAAHAPAGAPWSRCPTCNTPLQTRSAFEAAGEIPARVARAGWPLTWFLHASALMCSSASSRVLCRILVLH